MQKSICPRTSNSKGEIAMQKENQSEREWEIDAITRMLKDLDARKINDIYHFVLHISG